MSRYVVGVSGGIGSGKTTVTDLFAQKGIEIIDADLIAREVVASGMPALQAIVQKLGPQILQEDGELDRTSLRESVFSDPDLKTWLNNLLHPLIREKMVSDIEQADSVYCILSVPLLVENKLDTLVNRVLIVDVQEEIQLQRTVKRDNSNASQIRRIMQAQASREERLKVADDIVDNNADLASLVSQIDKLHIQYLKLAANHP